MKTEFIMKTENFCFRDFVLASNFGGNIAVLASNFGGNNSVFVQNYWGKCSFVNNVFLLSPT